MGGTVGRSRSPSIENQDGDECGREYEHNLGDEHDWLTVENDDEDGDEHDPWGRDSSCSSDWLVAPLGDVLHLEVIIDHWITEEYKQGIAEYV